jgi:formylglycine-generating enzyme required for sulfatase activity
LDEAEKKADEALKDDPDCQEAKNLKSRIATDRTIAKALEEGWAAFHAKNYDLERQKAKSVLDLDPSNKGAKRLLEELSGEDWIESPTRKAGTLNALTIGGVQYSFVWVPAGTFVMGSGARESGRSNDETAHNVTLRRGSWVLQTEVTQALYEAVTGDNPSRRKGGDLPVENVTYYDALDFCAALEKSLPADLNLKVSLPTEAQFEYMTRAGSNAAFPWGDDVSEIANRINCAESGKRQTTPVKSYPANAWGLYDLNGNVQEWVLDRLGDYSSQPSVDPQGPVDGAQRVVRGGGWKSGASSCRSAVRSAANPDKASDDLGFRVVIAPSK